MRWLSFGHYRTYRRASAQRVLAAPYRAILGTPRASCLTGFLSTNTRHGLTASCTTASLVRLMRSRYAREPCTSAMDRRTGKPLTNCMFLSGLGAPRRLISLALLKVPHGGAQCTQKTSGFSSNPCKRERPSLLQRSSFMTLMPEALQMWSTGTALEPLPCSAWQVCRKPPRKSGYDPQSRCRLQALLPASPGCRVCSSRGPGCLFPLALPDWPTSAARLWAVRLLVNVISHTCLR